MLQGRISGQYSRTTRNFPRRNHERIVRDIDVDELAITVARALLMLSLCSALFISARLAVFLLVFGVSIVRKDSYAIPTPTQAAGGKEPQYLSFTSARYVWLSIRAFRGVHDCCAASR